MNELARRNDLGALPEGREVFLVASDQIIGTGGIGTFEKDVVIWIFGYFETA